MSHLLNKLIGRLFKKEPDEVSVEIERTESLLMVWLSVNGGRRARIQCVIESDSTILVGDIVHYDEVRDRKKGYGTMMMKHLLAYAKENGYCYIYGNLSVVDLNHKERLHYFYEKLGFKVTEYTEPQGCYYGLIEMRLQ